MEEETPFSNRLHLILHADDYGISESANLAIRDAHARGCLTSTSLMANMPGLEDAIRHQDQVSGLGIGIHISLNVGRPVSDYRNLDRLTNTDGFFHGSFLWHLQASRSPRYQEQAKREIFSQLERLLDRGFKLDHMNSQSHLHMIPPLFDIFADAAVEAGIPHLRNSSEPWRGHPTGSGIANYLKRILILTLLLRASKNSNDVGFIGIRHSGQMIESSLIYYVENLPDGVWEVLTHPGTAHLTRESEYQHFVAKYLSDHNRRKEWEGLISQSLSEAIQQRGASLLRFCDLP